MSTAELELRVRRDLQHLPVFFHLTLSEIAAKYRASRSACVALGKLHSLDSITPFRVAQTFSLTAVQAEGVFRELLGKAHQREMPAAKFWGSLALFSRSSAEDVECFLLFFLPQSADYAQSFNFLFQRVFEPTQQISDPHAFVSACLSAVREFSAPPSSEISDSSWRDLLSIAKIPAPLAAASPKKSPKTGAVRRRATSSRRGVPNGGFGSLSGSEMGILQNLWFESGGSSSGDRPLDMRVFMVVLRNASKNPKQSEFLDKVVANLMAVGSSQGPKFFESRRTFEEIVRLLLPNENSFSLSARKIETSDDEQPDDAICIGNAALVEMRTLYTLLKDERNIGESLKLSSDEISRLPRISLDSFEKFLKDFLPRGFVGDVSKMQEWVDADAGIQGVGNRVNRPSVVLKDLPPLKPDAADAEVRKLEQKLNSGNSGHRKSVVDTRRLVFNEISFERPHTTC